MREQAYCTYVHCRPDGTPFYAGKGVLGRARDFSPSRRTLHHQNIVNKYGRRNIRICVFLSKDEADAFASEVELIKRLRADGHKLINLTDGGEGASGRKSNQAQLEGLKKGRGKDHFWKMSDVSKINILDGLRRGREKLKTSPAFLSHLENLKLIGRENFNKTHGPREIICVECGKTVVMHSLKAKCCSRLCEQRYRRARRANARN